MMPCAIRTNASSRFSMSGRITSSLQIGFGDSARDDRRLREPEVAAVADPLLRMTDRRALHRPLHRAGAATRADVETLEPERVADDLRIVVLLARRSRGRPSRRRA